MIETKVVRIENSEEAMNETSKVRGCFGWTVANVQVTHSENTKTYSSVWDQIGGNRSATVETNIVDYATVTLQRDTALTHYMDLVDLEEEYDALIEKAEEFRAVMDKNNNAESLMSLLLDGPLGRMMTRRAREEKSRAAAQAQAELDKVQARMKDILRQARSMLH